MLRFTFAFLVLGFQLLGAGTGAAHGKCHG
jgi:hypothetical protein